VYPVNTDISGNCLVVINPAASFDAAYTSYDVNFFKNIPYYMCSTAGNGTPFSVTPAVNSVGPFNSYASSSLGAAADSVVISMANL